MAEGNRLPSLDNAPHLKTDGEFFQPPSGAQNRYAIRLAGHQSPRHVLRDGTAWLLLADEERLANVRVST